MVILFVHNYYQREGGEDAGVRQERDLLAAAGHRIVEYSRCSGEIALNGISSRIKLGAGALWSSRTHSELRSLIAKERPEVAYIHNTIPLISPSAYFACAEAGVPVIQTLHNYRFLCPASTFLRRGQICEECVTSTLFRSVWHGCYRDSASARPRPASGQTGALHQGYSVGRPWSLYRARVVLQVASPPSDDDGRSRRASTSRHRRRSRWHERHYALPRRREH